MPYASGELAKMTDRSEIPPYPTKAKAPQSTIGGRRSSDSDHREQVQFVTEAAPQVTPNVAAVLARIVRTLRDHQKREAA
jgi:hypothetical protein